MASHFKWYPAESEVVVPFNARYSFPSQSNKAIKMTPRIPPKNQGTFSPGNVIRLEFPAQGYVNPGKTTFEFDVQMIYTPSDGEFSYVRFQNNIQSIISRVRLLYGATPLEDIPNYNVIVRQLTEWTGTGTQGSVDQCSIADGIGGTCTGASGQFQNTDPATGVGARAITNVNVRQKYIHGIDFAEQVIVTPGGAGTNSINAATGYDNGIASGAGLVPNGNGVSTALAPITGNGATLIHQTVRGSNPIRRYQVQLMLGLLNQEKLIPTKFMASQLAIELTLENPAACMYYVPSVKIVQPTSVPATTDLGTPSSVAPTYQVTNVNMIPEILEFDASYDESFLRGLQTGGVPIKFSTWNNYRFSSNGISNANLQIQERSRSVKSIFCMQRRDPPTYGTDSGASFFNTATGIADGATSFQEYQYRIGGRYFPAQPVQCTTSVGGKIPNGGCEAYVELAKALNTLGDYRLSTAVVPTKFAMNPASTSAVIGSTHSILPEFDFDYALVGWKYTGSPVINQTAVLPTAAQTSTTMVCVQRAGDCGSSCFAMAIDLETSNGLEISGLNAEEQSDISLIARFSDSQASGYIFDVFTHIDSMIVLRENNVIILLIIGLGIDSISKLYDSFNKWVITDLTKLLNILKLYLIRGMLHPAVVKCFRIQHRIQI